MSPAPSGQTMNGLSDRPDTLHAPDNSIGTIFGQDANAKSLQSVAAKTDISITIIDGHVVSGTDKSLRDRIMEAYDTSIEKQRSAGKSDAGSRATFWAGCIDSVKSYTLETSEESDRPGEPTIHVRRQLRDIMIMARREQCVADMKRYRAWKQDNLDACPTVTGPNYVANYCDWVWDLLGEQEREEARKYGEERGIQTLDLYERVQSGSEVSDTDLQLYYLVRPWMIMKKEKRKDDAKKYWENAKEYPHAIRWAAQIGEDDRRSQAAGVKATSSVPGNLQRSFAA